MLHKRQDYLALIYMYTILVIVFDRIFFSFLPVCKSKSLQRQHSQLVRVHLQLTVDDIFPIFTSLSSVHQSCSSVIIFRRRHIDGRWYSSCSESDRQPVIACCPSVCLSIRRWTLSVYFVTVQGGREKQGAELIS